jgi:hypothetical protein
MEELFRFVALRAPEAIEVEAAGAIRLESVVVGASSSLEEMLEGRATIDQPEQGNILLGRLVSRLNEAASESNPPSPNELIRQVM